MKRFLLIASLLLASLATQAAPRLKVVASVPDLGSIAKAIGGEDIDLTVLARPGEDPHFVELRPGFVKSTASADLLLINGMELEVGWIPLLQQRAGNRAILDGQPGLIDASQAIRARGKPAGDISRSLGDVHAAGNPHYLLDPLNGLLVADLLRQRFAAQRPAVAAQFNARYRQFAEGLGQALFGPLARLYPERDWHKLAQLHEHGKLVGFLQQQGQQAQLGGWLGRLAKHYGSKAIDDHEMWVYLAARFGIDIRGHMEPKPGILPTSRHLATLAQQMRSESIRLIISAMYYDPRHAEFLARASGADIARLAHLAGATPGNDTYLDWMEFNVKTLEQALAR